MSVVSSPLKNGNGAAMAFDSNGNDEIKREVKEETMSDDDVPWGELVKRDKKDKKNKQKRNYNDEDGDGDEP
uniref:Uncharacterized protein n=1 Tax=Caenorhabditis japonica TaxID=281687 RepID=A0A8R1IRF7_CAEJA